MFLHHFNIGYPLVAEATQLAVSNQSVCPRDTDARKGLDSWAIYEKATAGYPEQVFFHHPKADDEQVHQNAYALVYRDGLGLLLKWDAKNQPYFTQWKNTRQGLYVSGIEPGNCIPEGLNAARRNNRLKLLEPGETQSFYAHLIVMEKLETIEHWRKYIVDLQKNGTPVEGCNLDDYANRS
jgi:hypothetical protein